MLSSAFEDYIREWQEKYGDMSYNEILRKSTDAKPIDCKYCECVCCGPLGKTYCCLNKSSKYYLQQPLLCFGECDLYEKENKENE